jgi:hypothetical protein
LPRVIELLIGAVLVAGTLTWSRYESAVAQRALGTAGEGGQSSRRRVALGLLLVLGVTLIVGGITRT